RRAAGEYGEIFGRDGFFLELQDHGLPEQRQLNGQLLRLAPELGLPLVVTNDLHYVRADQSEAHDVLLCVGTGNNLDTPGRLKFETSEFYVKSTAQMAALFPDQREAILNSRRIAREQGIQTTCRGSAPGSIVTYTLGITPVDPILYQLPFERFLNPDRVTMPDIDVDFEDGRRDEVIAYVGRKYGQDHVAQIITFGTMLARAAIRDVG